MCADIGVSRAFMTELKKGRAKTVTFATAQKLADYFNVSVDYFDTEKEKNPDTNVSEVDLRIANVIKVMTDEQKELFLNLAEQLIQQ